VRKDKRKEHRIQNTVDRIRIVNEPPVKLGAKYFNEPPSRGWGLIEFSYFHFDRVPCSKPRKQHSGMTALGNVPCCNSKEAVPCCNPKGVISRE
jgi:hypothetical protein